MARPEKNKTKESEKHPISSVFVERRFYFSIHRIMFSSKNSHKRTNKKK